MDSQKHLMGMGLVDDLSSQKNLLGVGFSQEDFASLTSSQLNLLSTYDEGEMDTPPGECVFNESFLTSSDAELGANSLDPNFQLSLTHYGENENTDGQDLDDSFNLSNMGNEMQVLSQDAEFCVPASQVVTSVLSQNIFRLLPPTGTKLTPPNSVEYLPCSDGYEHEQDGLSARMKYETEAQYHGIGLGSGEISSQAYMCDRNQVLTTQNDEYLFNTSGSSSTQESQGLRLPVLDNFEGPFKFYVESAEKNSKKCVFDQSLDKLFCLPHHAIMFYFYLDFNLVPLKQLSIHATLYYTLNSQITKNVDQCINCQMQNKTGELNGISLPNHVVRCGNPLADYIKKRGDHGYVTVPLEKPQLGANRISRNYTFVCMNSCFGKSSKDLKPWTLMFYLMDGDKEVGRYGFNIKICKCPGRDSQNEQASNKKKGIVQGNRGVKNDNEKKPSPKKSEPPVKTEDLELGANHSPKRARQSLETESGEMRQSGLENEMTPSSLSQRPGPSGLVSSTKLTGSRTSPLCKSFSQTETDSESFSQDDSQCVGFMLKVSESMKLALAHRKHPDPILSHYSNMCLKQVTNFERSMQFYRKYVIKQEIKEEPELDQTLTLNENEKNDDGHGAQL